MPRAVLRQGLVALVLALSAVAASASVRVVEPADHATLAGGSTAVIRWAGAVDGGDIEEWEAFLSVDGGRYYSARITPHLDVSIHEFRWTVPNVASSDVRILLRFGNETDEHVTELPLALTIEPSPARSGGRERVSERGEPARPGDPGVAEWAEGDRGGAQVTQVAACIPAIAAADTGAADERSAVESAGFALHRSRTQVPVAVPRESQRSRPALLLTADVLLRCRRLNI